jgi:hypothetical protein
MHLVRIAIISFVVGALSLLVPNADARPPAYLMPSAPAGPVTQYAPHGNQHDSGHGASTPSFAYGYFGTQQSKPHWRRYNGYYGSYLERTSRCAYRLTQKKRLKCSRYLEIRDAYV